MTPAIVDAVRDLYTTAADALSRGEDGSQRSALRQFAHTELLRRAMDSALQAYGLPTEVVGEGWPSFARLLASILADQPLNSPTDDFRALIFHTVPRDRTEIGFTMRFARPIGDRNSVEFLATLDDHPSETD